MKTETKKIDATKRQINIEVSGETVKNKFEEVFTRINKEAKVSGFRPGHVPRDILEKKFSASAHELVLKELIPELYNQALQKEALDVIDLPEISEVKLDRNMLSFQATVEISPEIDVKNYKKIKIGYKKTEISLEEIKRFIDSMKEARKIEVIDDSFARGLGYLDLSALEKSIEMQLFIQKQNQERQKMESELIEKLLKSLDFKVPQALVNRQLGEMVRQAKLDMALKGIPREKIEEEEKKLNEEMREEAQKQVKVYLVLSQIAKKENIPVDDHMPRRVIELLLREADWGQA